MKKFALAILIGCFAGAALAASVGTTTAAATVASATWQNTVLPARAVALKGAFITFGGNVNDTITATVANGGVTYTLDSVAIANTTAVARIDFDIATVIAAGDTVSFTRTAASTNQSISVMFVYE